MTTPLPEINSYIAAPDGTGNSSAIGVKGFNSVYVDIPAGISTVTVTWAGSGYINAWCNSVRSTTGGWIVGTLPHGSETRSVMFKVPFSRSTGVLWFRVMGASAEDVSREIGIEVVTFPA